MTIKPQKVPERCQYCCALTQYTPEDFEDEICTKDKINQYYCDCGRDADGYEYQGEDMSNLEEIIRNCGTSDLAQITVSHGATMYTVHTLATTANAQLTTLGSATVSEPGKLVDLLKEICGANFDLEIIEVI